MNSIAQPALAQTSFDQFITKHISNIIGLAIFSVLFCFASDVFAQVDTTACTRIEGFFGSINKILNAVSVTVVTIAVVFAGYQIAFAHKRISDVAPILIGGLFIGGASQIALMLLPAAVKCA